MKTFNEIPGMPAPTGSSSWLSEHVGIIAALEAPENPWTMTSSGDRIPQSYIVKFTDGQKRFWPSWVDEDGEIRPWDRYDPRIDFSQPVRVYREEVCDPKTGEVRKHFRCEQA